MGVSARPSEAGEFSSLEKLVANEKPPKLPDSELRLLDIHVVGISSVRDALNQRPFQYLDYRTLSRYVSRVALQEAQQCEIVTQLQDEKKLFLKTIKNYEERIRRFFDDSLRAEMLRYRPFLSKQQHLWAWDSGVRDGISETILGAGLSISAFTIFCAKVLSGLPGLARISDDLIAEYEQGLRCLRMVLVNYKHINDELGANDPK